VKTIKNILLICLLGISVFGIFAFKDEKLRGTDMSAIAGQATASTGNAQIVPESLF
jgi:hypothetical protein